MKVIKICLVFSIAVGSVISAYAQQATVVGQGYYDESDFGKFYLRIGASFLESNFLKHLNDGAIEIGEEVLENRYTGSTGLNLELGSYYFLHSEPIADLLKVGLDVTFLSLGYIPIEYKWGDLEEYDLLNTSSDFTTIGAKIGPVISFNPLYNLYVDAFAKAAPTLLTSLTDMDALEEVLFAWKSDIGVNLRYKKGTLTASYEGGTFKPDPADFLYQEPKIPMGMFQIKLGLQF